MHGSGQNSNNFDIFEIGIFKEVAMATRESDQQAVVRRASEVRAARISELSRDPGGLGPGDIVQIAQREADEYQEETLEFLRRLD